MGNHCVEIYCGECGYYECARCSDSGISYIPDFIKKKYQKDKDNKKLSTYSLCPNCGKRSFN